MTPRDEQSAATDGRPRRSYDPERDIRSSIGVPLGRGAWSRPNSADFALR
jgi:hypothetical protein